MDSYLAIAEQVIAAARVPLTPREILRRAYLADLVPPKLHGRTQHKTLQARISEDILRLRDRSAFFRPRPGQFFLRQFLSDESIPLEHRQPIIARRRARDLKRRDMLSFRRSDIRPYESAKETLAPQPVIDLIQQQAFRYLADPNEREVSDVLLWSFVIVLRDNFVLSYRAGRYREDRDAFLNKRCIGFSVPVSARDRDIFNITDHGIVAAGVNAVVIDLDMPSDGYGESDYTAYAHLENFVLHCGDSETRDLVGVVKFVCPEWFEPLKRRLAINDLMWLDLRTPFNDMNDFDPWSRQIIESGMVL